jgi:hypothetical protein
MEESSCSKLLTTSLVLTSPSTPSHPSDGYKILNEIMSTTASPPNNVDDANDECSDDEYYYIGDVYIDHHSPLTPSCISAFVSTSVATAAPFTTTSKVEQQVQQILPTRKIAAAAKTAAVVGELLRGYEATPPPSSSTSTTLNKRNSKRRRSLRLQEKPTQLLQSSNSISSSDDDNQQELITIVQQIYNQPYSWCFHQPVDNSIVPDYATVITHPIDLSTIMTRITTTTPSSCGNTDNDNNKKMYNKHNLYSDLRLMIHNCKLEFLAPLTAFSL